MVREENVGAAAAGAGAGVHREKIHTQPLLNDPNYVMILSFIVLVFTVLIWWCLTRRRTARNCVLLTGVSDAGKTLLFVKLVYSEFRQTFTSMRENVEMYTAGNSTLRIVDVPGAERLRGRVLAQYRASARAVVFVLDSVSVQKEVRDVAEYLYTILSDRVIQSNSPPVLVVCNKQDQPLAKGSQVIKSLLEKEINLLRITKSNQLQSVDPSQTSAAVFLGKQGRDFEFSHIGNKVEFAECSALNENDNDNDTPIDIEAVEKWIAKL